MEHIEPMGSMFYCVVCRLTLPTRNKVHRHVATERHRTATFIREMCQPPPGRIPADADCSGDGHGGGGDAGPNDVVGSPDPDRAHQAASDSDEPAAKRARTAASHAAGCSDGLLFLPMSQALDVVLASHVAHGAEHVSFGPFPNAMFALAYLLSASKSAPVSDARTGRLARMQSRPVG